MNLYGVEYNVGDIVEFIDGNGASFSHPPVGGLGEVVGAGVDGFLKVAWYSLTEQDMRDEVDRRYFRKHGCVHCYAKRLRKVHGKAEQFNTEQLDKLFGEAG